MVLNDREDNPSQFNYDLEQFWFHNRDNRKKEENCAMIGLQNTWNIGQIESQCVSG